MTVYHETAAVFNGFEGKEVLKMAALASNPANKDDAIDRAVYQAYAKMAGHGKDVDTAAEQLLGSTVCVARPTELVAYPERGGRSGRPAGWLAGWLASA